MQFLRLFSILIFISSCGGGGGGGGGAGAPEPVTFLITLGLTSFTVDEDSSFSGSIAASANESVTFTYSIDSQPSNGTLSLTSSNAQITYTPNTNFFGSDQFQYTVTASNNTTKSGTVNITVNSVNDPPSLILLETNDSYENIFSDENFTIKVQVDDVDNEISELVFSSSSDYGNLNTSFNSEDSIVTIDSADYSFAGPLDIDLSVSDGSDSASTQVKFWNLKKISDDLSTNLTYTFFGNHSSSDRLTNYIFIIEGLEESERGYLKTGLKDFMDFINDSGIEYFINNFFNIQIIELGPDEDVVKIQTGTSLKEDNNFDDMTDDEVDTFFETTYEDSGCSLRAPNMYCANAEFFDNIEKLIRSFGFNDIDNVSIITGTDGRGVAYSGRFAPLNIQNLIIGTNASEDVYVRYTLETLKHEFGHSFIDLADEYRSDYWDPEENPDGAINCRPVNDFYDDLEEYDIDEDGVIDSDENTEIQRDGIIFDWPCHWVDAYPNTTSEDEPELFKWKHLFENPDNIPGFHDENDREGIGIFTGTYYGIEHTFRASYENIMGSISRSNREEWWYFGNKTSGTSWDKVGIDSFVIQALKQQGLHDLDYQFSDSGVALNLNIIIPDDLFEIRWFIDGVLDESFNNQTALTFSKKGFGWQKIAYRIFEKNDQTNFISVEDPIDTYADVYQGSLSSFYQPHFCDEPYSDVEGYEESVCFGTVTAYDIENGTTNSYRTYDVKTFDDLMSLYGGSENNHWMEFFIEYSGLGGQIGINWSNF